MPNASGGSGPSPSLAFLLVLGATMLLAGALLAFGAALAHAAVWWKRRIARLKATLGLIDGSLSKGFCQERYRAYRADRRADSHTRQDIADPGNTSDDDLRAECQDFLNHDELGAPACRQGLIDEAFHHAWMGPTLLRDRAEAGVLVTEARRAPRPGDVANPQAYVEFQRLARRWGATTPPPAR